MDIKLRPQLAVDVAADAAAAEAARASGQQDTPGSAIAPPGPNEVDIEMDDDAAGAVLDDLILQVGTHLGALRGVLCLCWGSWAHGAFQTPGNLRLVCGFLLCCV